MAAKTTGQTVAAQNKIYLGPNYDKGLRAVGRNVLPRGLVAIPGDAESLRLAIAELHEYANSNRQNHRPRAGIVFRIVDSEEQQTIGEKILNHAGVKLFNQGVFQVSAGSLHILDDSALSHSCNRHADEEMEAMHGHSAVTVADFQRIPLVAKPRNITKFVVVKRMPRIVYTLTDSLGVLTVVEEIQARSLAVKTVYKK
jgi:hypothetical protein